MPLVQHLEDAARWRMTFAVRDWIERGGTKEHPEVDELERPDRGARLGAWHARPTPAVRGVLGPALLELLARHPDWAARLEGVRARRAIPRPID